MKGVWKKRNFLSTYPLLHCTNNLSVDVQSQKNVQAQIPYTSGPTLWYLQRIALKFLKFRIFEILNFHPCKCDKYQNIICWLILLMIGTTMDQAYFYSLPPSVDCWYDNLCKQFGPRSGRTNCWAWSWSKLFSFTLWWYSWKNLNKKLILKKISRWQKTCKNTPTGRQRVQKTVWVTIPQLDHSNFIGSDSVTYENFSSTTYEPVRSAVVQW